MKHCREPYKNTTATAKRTRKNEPNNGSVRALKNSSSLQPGVNPENSERGDRRNCGERRKIPTPFLHFPSQLSLSVAQPRLVHVWGM